METTKFIILSQDSYFKAEMKSFFNESEYRTIFIDNADFLRTNPELISGAQYVLLDLQKNELPVELIDHYSSVNFIILQNRQSLMMNNRKNLRFLNKNNLLTIIQKYKYGIVFDDQLVI